MSTLGANVRAVRQSRGLTQEQLADRLGVGKAYVCHVERGSRTAKSLVPRIAEALGVTTEQLDGAPLSTTSTAWGIEYAPTDAGPWSDYETPDDEAEARVRLRTLRERHADEHWRVVRAETTETVEVW